MFFGESLISLRTLPVAESYRTRWDSPPVTMFCPEGSKIALKSCSLGFALEILIATSFGS